MDVTVSNRDEDGNGFDYELAVLSMIASVGVLTMLAGALMYLLG